MLPWQQQVSWIAAFVYGLASFVSPCVLPLIPAYFGVLAGDPTMPSGPATSRERWRLLRTGCLFVLGFSIIFIAMGMTASALGRWLLRWSDALRIASGVLIILMGTVSLGIRVPFLGRERRADLGKIAARGAGRWFMPPLLGMGFALGWTPCVGPVLSSVLLLAANQQTLWQGAGLLGLYSLGMGVPFLALAALSNAALPLIRKINRALPWIQRIGGVIMIAMGVMMIMNWFTFLAAL